uniref:G protein-coupled receptor 137Ba-like isoform X2 n=1 Tax=Myxine glutinosa TaxID=7769 RepID=UPI00358F0D24
MDIPFSAMADPGLSPRPLKPSVKPSVEFALTVVFTFLYSLLFLYVYGQLWLVLCYRYKRFGFQTVFLFLCLTWAGLRATLFSFYFKNCELANTLEPFTYWFLYCLPVCLQFLTLCLLHLYFSQVVIRARARNLSEQDKYKLLLRGALFLASLVFLSVNLSCALLVQLTLPYTTHRSLVLIRVIRVLINDLLFVACATSLTLSMYRMAKLPSASVYLYTRGTTVCQAVAVGTAITLLYASRACYNLLVLVKNKSDPNAFNCDWYNVSDQADLKDLTDKGYVVFGIILIIWELLPTSLMVILFRVQRPDQSAIVSGVISAQGYGSRVYFFDNPRRYDSDDDLSRTGSLYCERASLSSGAYSQATSYYGSLNHPSSYRTTGLPTPVQPASSPALSDPSIASRFPRDSPFITPCS